MFWKGVNFVWVVEGLREVGLRRVGNCWFGSVKEFDSWEVKYKGVVMVDMVVVVVNV